MFFSPTKLCLQGVLNIQSFDSFSKEAAPPASPVFVAELFHGPTYCFKDLGQQLLVRLLARFAERDKQKKTFLVSGAQQDPLGKMALKTPR